MMGMSYYLIDSLHQPSLLWINSFRLYWLQPKERSIKHAQVFIHQISLSNVEVTGMCIMLVVKPLRAEATEGNFTPYILRILKKRP
jgi:hypothetical protein